MNRRALRRLGLAALAVVALAVAAATVDTTVVPEAGGGPGVGSGDAGGIGTGNGDDAGLTDGRAGRIVSLSVCYPILNDPRVIAAVVLAFLVVGYLAYRDTGSLLPPLALWVAFGVPVVVIHAILTSCAPARPIGLGGTSAAGNVTLLPGGAGAGALGSQAGRTVSAPTALLGVLLVIALVGALLVLVVSTTDEDEPPAEPDAPEPPAPEVSAVGRAAGAAADRIEADADVDNEVFRAWAEMTSHLDVPNPAASTPAEFAAAAVDAGMARDDVRELTALFEAVRYGGESATADRERRAVDALRRIEAAYAPDEGLDADLPDGRTGADGDGPDRPRGDGGSGGRSE